MLLKQHIDFHSSSDYHENKSCIHYVQTLPSVLQEMPWIQHEKQKVYIQGIMCISRVAKSVFSFILCEAFRCNEICERSSQDLPSTSNNWKGIDMCKTSVWNRRSAHCIYNRIISVLHSFIKRVEFLTAGVGKSHYIRQQLVKSSHSVTIAVNEGFEPLKTIQRLHILPKDQPNCAIYFNFNLIPPVGVSRML